MYERLKKIRESKRLSQAEFAKMLGMGQSTLAMMEVGKRDILDRHIKTICSIFNVNEEWLRYGKGEMYDNVPKDELDRLAERYHLPSLAKKIVEAFVTLEEKEMDTVLKLVKEIASVAYEELCADKEVDLAQKEEFEIETEVEAYRLELQAEKKGITSSVSEDTKDSQKKSQKSKASS